MASGRFDAGGAGGRITRIAFTGEGPDLRASRGDTTRLHHDIEPLPNGHVLAIAWEWMPEADAPAAGRPDERVDVAGLWSEVLEPAPAGPDTTSIVWQWRALDHFGDGTRRIDIAAGGQVPTEAGRPRLIVGSELRLADGPCLVLLAADRAGYGRLSRLVSQARRSAEKGRYHLTRAMLDATREGEGAAAETLPGCLALILLPSRR